MNYTKFYETYQAVYDLDRKQLTITFAPGVATQLNERDLEGFNEIMRADKSSTSTPIQLPGWLNWVALSTKDITSSEQY